MSETYLRSWIKRQKERMVEAEEQKRQGKDVATEKQLILEGIKDIGVRFELEGEPDIEESLMEEFRIRLMTEEEKEEEKYQQRRTREIEERRSAEKRVAQAKAEAEAAFDGVTDEDEK